MWPSLPVLKGEIQVMYFKRLEGVNTEASQNGHVTVLTFYILRQEKQRHSTHTLTLTSTHSQTPCSLCSLLFFLPALSSVFYVPGTAGARESSWMALPSLQWAGSNLQLAAGCTGSSTSLEPALHPRYPGGGPAHPAQGSAWFTFGMQEVERSSNVPHHSAGFSLVEVLPLLDVGEDGAWGTEGTPKNGS